MANTITLLVAASGSLSGASLGAGSSAASAVRDNDGATSYIYAAARVGALINSFTLDGNMIPYYDNVDGVTISAYIAAGTGTVSSMQVNLGIRIGGTNYFAGAQTVTSTSYTLFTSNFVLNPATSAAWTKYDIDALEILVSLNGGTGTAQCRCTQHYADIIVGGQTDALLFGT